MGENIQATAYNAALAVYDSWLLDAGKFKHIEQQVSLNSKSVISSYSHRVMKNQIRPVCLANGVVALTRSVFMKWSATS